MRIDRSKAIAVAIDNTNSGSAAGHGACKEPYENTANCKKVLVAFSIGLAFEPADLVDLETEP